MITGMRQSKPLIPSPQQQAVIDEVVSGDSHIIINAYAGTGKTSLLLMLLPYMQGSTFMGAFNVAIKKELEERVAKMGLSRPDLSIKTIHGAGLAAYKYGGGSKFAKVESNKMHFIIDALADPAGAAELGKRANPSYSTYSSFIHKLVGFGKRAGVGVLVDDEEQTWLDLIEHYGVDEELPDVEDEDEADELVSRLIRLTQIAYQVSLDCCNDEIDFDDMLLAPLYFDCRFNKYDWVCVDELQDCSAIRREIAVRMLKPNGRLIGVGDFYQTIFGFTGTEPDAMGLMVTKLLQRGKVTELPLSVTYRCPKVVVKLANTWVPQLEAHPTAPDGEYRVVHLEPGPCPCCFGAGERPNPADPQAESVPCGECGGGGKEGHGFWEEASTLDSDCAILCRVNRPIVELAYQLLRKGIPCQIEGRDFAGSLIKLCQRWKVRDLNTLEKRLVGYREHEAGKWRKKRNEERAVGVEDKVDTILCLLDAVRSAGKLHVSDLIDKINMMFGDTEVGQRPKVLTLSSIHRYKGKEAQRVYILGRSKWMPSKWATSDWECQSERNLEYVAVTRSKMSLIDVVVK